LERRLKIELNRCYREALEKHLIAYNYHASDSKVELINSRVNSLFRKSMDDIDGVWALFNEIDMMGEKGKKVLPPPFTKQPNGQGMLQDVLEAKLEVDRNTIDLNKLKGKIKRLDIFIKDKGSSEDINMSIASLKEDLEAKREKRGRLFKALAEKEKEMLSKKLVVKEVEVEAKDLEVEKAEKKLKKVWENISFAQKKIERIEEKIGENGCNLFVDDIWNIEDEDIIETIGEIERKCQEVLNLYKVSSGILTLVYEICNDEKISQNLTRLGLLKNMMETKLERTNNVIVSLESKKNTLEQFAKKKHLTPEPVDNIARKDHFRTAQDFPKDTNILNNKILHLLQQLGGEVVGQNLSKILPEGKEVENVDDFSDVIKIISEVINEGINFTAVEDIVVMRELNWTIQKLFEKVHRRLGYINLSTFSHSSEYLQEREKLDKIRANILAMLKIVRNGLVLSGEEEGETFKTKITELQKNLEKELNEIERGKNNETDIDSVVMNIKLVRRTIATIDELYSMFAKKEIKAYELEFIDESLQKRFDYLNKKFDEYFSREKENLQKELRIKKADNDVLGSIGLDMNLCNLLNKEILLLNSMKPEVLELEGKILYVEKELLFYQGNLEKHLLVEHTALAKSRNQLINKGSLDQNEFNGLVEIEDRMIENVLLLMDMFRARCKILTARIVLDKKEERLSLQDFENYQNDLRSSVDRAITQGGNLDALLESRINRKVQTSRLRHFKILANRKNDFRSEFLVLMKKTELETDIGIYHALFEKALELGEYESLAAAGEKVLSFREQLDVLLGKELAKMGSKMGKRINEERQGLLSARRKNLECMYSIKDALDSKVSDLLIKGEKILEADLGEVEDADKKLEEIEKSLAEKQRLLKIKTQKVKDVK
jgi:hypothetical protein